LERLQTFNDSADSEIVVALGAVKSTNDQVDDAKMEGLLGWLFNSNSILFLFDTLHELLSVCILTCHDVGHAKVGQDNSCYGEQVVHLPPDEWFIVSDGILVLLVLHEEYMGHVELPCLVLTAVFG
jgi:hypothetical protein